ncbi:uncharacterized protein VTP21DRAFT_4815 [Calcarisporiella thermophila]|uniref:uncharacterized protein n=1 Tax=Calcarisporiella thermophila TaxID=911321 RepID=UPI003742B4D1
MRNDHVFDSLLVLKTLMTSSHRMLSDPKHGPNLKFRMHTAKTPVIVVLGAVRYSRTEFEELTKQYIIHVMIPPNPADFVEADTGLTRNQFLSDCTTRYNGMIALFRGYIPIGSKIWTEFNFDADFVNTLPDTVRIITLMSSGYSHVDVDACTKRGIWVSNTRGAVDAAVADTTIYLMLSALRNFPKAEKLLREGRWSDSFENHQDPEGLRLGVLGMGAIGKAVAQRAKVFGMEIQYHNRHRLPPEEEQGAIYVSLETLLSTSDILTLHVPLADDTHHLLSTPEFSMVKRGCILINTSRGPVVDEEALVHALETGQVRAAGLDVFENEPYVNPRLLAHENTTLLPHVGTYTQGTFRKMELKAIENLLKFLEEGKPLTPVNNPHVQPSVVKTAGG